MSKENSNSSIIVEKSQNGVSTITLNRPELHNAFDDHFIKELTEAIRDINQDETCKILVLAANGKSFSAGADLNWMKRMSGYSWDENYHDSLKLAGLMQELHDCKKTTIAIVKGAAFGGGVGLVACCDIVLSSEHALFCLSEVKLGLIPSVISPYVVKAIGERNAKRYFVTAEQFDAQDAKEMNLVHKIFAKDEIDMQTSDYINRILANSPEAMYQAKRLVDYVADKEISEEVVLETAQRIADIRASSEGKEGVAAFLEKRPANWAAANNNEF